MIKLKDMLRDLFEASANAGSYKADEGEPDTGFLQGGKKRQLGQLAGKPEPWFEGGGYTQVEFPEADYIRGKGVEPEQIHGYMLKQKMEWKNNWTQLNLQYTKLKEVRSLILETLIES